MDELERLGLDDDFGVAYDNEAMQKRMINTARNWGYDDGYGNGYEIGITKGKEEGAKEKGIEIAKNLLNIGTSNEDIMKVTGLSVEELEELKKEV